MILSKISRKLGLNSNNIKPVVRFSKMYKNSKYLKYIFDSEFLSKIGDINYKNISYFNAK